MLFFCRSLTVALATFALFSTDALAQQSVSTDQFLAASQTALEEQPSEKERTTTDTSGLDSYYLVEDVAANSQTSRLIQDAFVEPTQARSRGDRNTTRTASRSRRSARTPYMIGDSPLDGDCPHSMQAGGFAIDGLDIASVNHPLFTGNRFNAAEAGSFLPTDRFIFTYRHLHNASSTNILGNLDTVDIERFIVGLEKTALDGMVSAEIRIPLLLQLDSDQLFFANGTSQVTGDRSGELGNISVNFKALLANRRKFAMGAGLAVNIPTAEDFTLEQDFDTPFVIDPVNDVNGTADFGMFGQFQNDTVGLIPYLAWAFRPTPRFFQQGFFQIDVPLNSSDASLDVDGNIVPDTDYDSLVVSNTLSGEIQRQTLLRLNLGFGYWLKQGRKQGVPTGLAALFEVHYTTNLDDGENFNTPLGTLTDASATLPDIPLTAIAGGNRDFDVVNLSSGFALDLGGCVITNGVIVPISDDRQFDFEYNLQVNKRF